MYLNKSDLKNNILKCDQCKVAFNDYDQPRFLPCHETVCATCVVKIESEAVNRKFKCGICMKDHCIPEEGFSINKKISELIIAEPMEISRGSEYEKFQESLKKVLSITQLLCYDCENGADIIRDYCDEQIRIIQLSTENRIEQINKLSDELIAFIKKYEKTCIESYSMKKQSIIEVSNRITNETTSYINEKQIYLKKKKLNDEEMKILTKTTDELQLALKQKSKKLKNSIFNNKLIKFQSNNDKFNQYVIGNFDYEQLSASVFNFLFFRFWFFLNQIYLF
jgi:hypothetical protein